MSFLIYIILISAIHYAKVIFDFNKDTDISQWQEVNDDVMGGISTSTMTLTPEGYGLFKGRVSLENNGGFCSVRYYFNKISTKAHSKVILKVKGDGKKYQFRIKRSRTDRHSYVAYFNTSGEWEDIEIKLEEMYPTFRGRDLDLPNFDHEYIEKVGILIGNKKPEQFDLLVDHISLK